MAEERERVQTWLRRCLRQEAIEVHDHRMLRGYSGCGTMVCETGAGPIVLKLYSPESDDYSCLGPVDTARKHALALQEFPRSGCRRRAASGSRPMATRRPW